MNYLSYFFYLEDLLCVMRFYQEKMTDHGLLVLRLTGVKSRSSYTYKTYRAVASNKQD